MDRFSIKEPQYFTWYGQPVLVLDGVHCWNHERRHWADVSRDVTTYSQFLWEFERGRLTPITRKAFRRRYPAASAQLDNLEPRPGETLEKFEELLGDVTNGRWPEAGRDYWGIPDLSGARCRLPSYEELPTPAPLRFGPGDWHNYVSGPRMMLECSAAKRRLKGRRVGAWVMSPRTSFRWGIWRYAGVHWIPQKLVLPKELEVNCNDRID